MADNPVEVPHIEARFRTLSDNEKVNAEAWIADSWEILTSRRPSLSDDMDASTVSDNAVIRVISAMVIRRLQNPEGKSEESIDDYSYKRDPSTASGDLYVKNSEIDVVTPAVTGPRRTNSVRLVTYQQQVTPS